jgi:D-3-phosphoglycerate dehydrogenase / 2-oxoglutarate reductase
MSTNRKRLLLPDSMGRVGWDLLKDRDDIEAVGFPNTIGPEAFHALLKDASGAALGVTPFKEPELAAAPRIQVVARIGVGYDAVDVPALTRRKIPLMVAGTANSVAVAEKAMYLLMTLAKKGPLMNALVREGRWWDKLKNLPMEMFEKTVLIIGFGRIGTRIAKRCLGMEMQVLVYDPYVAAEKIRAAGCEPVSDLEAALPRADFVTIHCPKTPETLAMFNAARLARMKPTAYLVNTARGGLIDERALQTVLTEGKLAGAGLDVFEKEPTPLDHPLLKLPNVLVSPHVAGVTRESVDRMAMTAVRNLLSVLDGTPNRENAINPEVFD